MDCYKLVIASEMIPKLNRALQSDSGAITALFSVRVSCSKEFAEKSGIPCKKQVSGVGDGLSGYTQESYTMGALELLEGLLGIPIIMEVDKDRKITNFSLDTRT